MKQEFIAKIFPSRNAMVIEEADRIIEEYQQQGYTLTLRGLYYQFISRDTLPESWIDKAYNIKNGLDPDTKNTTKNYKRLGDLINDAKLAGILDWSAITDQGRSSTTIWGWDSPEEILRNSAEGYYIDKWATQPFHVEVMVEKDALSGIISPVCRDLQVGWSANKGYSSGSTMYRTGRRIKAKLEEGKRVLFLYLGDHDPSGLDMTNDVEGRLRMFAREHSAHITSEPDEYDFEVRRIALNMPQVRDFNPPPNPAKETDSRFKKYRDEYGDESWELDALPPPTISGLIEEAVLAVRDDSLWSESVEAETVSREEIGRFIDTWPKWKEAQP